MKKWICLLLALTMLIALCACDKDNAGPTQTQASGDGEAGPAPMVTTSGKETLEIPDVSCAGILKENSCGESANFRLYDNGVLVIGGTGMVSGIEFCKYGDYISYVRVEEGITGLGNKCLADLEKMLILELPTTMKTIEVAAVRDCTRLVRVNFPEGLETIERYAFTLCISLQSVTLPSSLRKLGQEAFGYCDLQELVIKNGLPQIDRGAFMSNDELEFVVIPGSVELVMDDAFSKCKALKTVILCPGVKSLGARSFENLKTVAMPDSLEYVGTSKMGEPNQVSSSATVYCNEGSYAASRYNDRCDLIVGYDGFIKNYDLSQYQ